MKPVIEMAILVLLYDINRLCKWHLFCNKYKQFKWLGGYQLAGSAEPGGGWQWVTGETFAYANWAGGEPNNSPDGENRVIFQHGWNLDGKEWNDLTDAWTQSGYVVEYEVTSSVPEPATMTLFIIGIVGLCCIRTKRNTEKSFHKG